MPEADFRAVFARAFGSGDCFSSFEQEPLACASIGQVHRARVGNRRSGGGQAASQPDRTGRAGGYPPARAGFLALLHPLFSEYTRNSIEAVLAAFRRTILQEVDMQAELANLERFRQAYPDSGVRMPVPYPRVQLP